MSANNLNAVFYANSYHPIQAGSIDGTDIVPHDNAVYRAVLCSAAGLYDPFGDPKVIGDPYCTLFVGRLSHQTSEEKLRKAMSAHGRVKNLRLVRHIVTGASCGYAFVEYESEREMRHAYMDVHHSIIDDSEVIADYSRQQLMPGWIPRRLGGGLGGKKESGQLRFGGRERPFRAPLRPIPYEDLKRLGIAPPPEGRFLSRFQVTSPPRSGKHMEMEDSPTRHSQSTGREDTPIMRQSNRAAINREDSEYQRPKDKKDTLPKWREDSHKRYLGYEDKEENLSKGRGNSHLRSRRSEGTAEDPPMWREDSHWRHQRSEDTGETPTKWKSNYSTGGESHHRRSVAEDSITKSPSGGADSLHKHHKHHSERSHRRNIRSPN